MSVVNRRTAVWVTVVALCLPLASPAGASYHPPTGFGGYNWFGNVTEISATWRVPTIAASSPVGHGSTWIGAQNADGQPPFMQLGTTEDKNSLSSVMYWAFWSDPHEGYHPQPLEALAANDVVSAEMARVNSGWRLTFSDLTSKRSKRLTVHYSPSGSYDQGEWLQEDPTANTNEASADLPYPVMSAVSFSKLQVDDAAPSLNLGDGATLLANGGAFLVPSAFEHDAFSLSPPNGPAKSYLVAASTLDAVVSTFEVATAQWSHLSKAERTLMAVGLSNGYRAEAFDLAFHSWPSKARHDVAALYHQDQRVQSDVKAWIRSGLSLNNNAYTTMSIDQGDGPLADQVRDDLGLPPA
jgi:hypothetical protein